MCAVTINTTTLYKKLYIVFKALVPIQDQYLITFSQHHFYSTTENILLRHRNMSKKAKEIAREVEKNKKTIERNNVIAPALFFCVANLKTSDWLFQVYHFQYGVHVCEKNCRKEKCFTIFRKQIMIHNERTVHIDMNNNNMVADALIRSEKKHDSVEGQKSYLNWNNLRKKLNHLYIANNTRLRRRKSIFLQQEICLVYWHIFLPQTSEVENAEDV